jgi:hypothetical protein
MWRLTRLRAGTSLKQQLEKNIKQSRDTSPNPDAPIANDRKYEQYKETFQLEEGDEARAVNESMRSGTHFD